MREISLPKLLAFSVTILLSVGASASMIAPAGSFAKTPTQTPNPASTSASSTPIPIVDTGSLAGWGQSTSAAQTVKLFTLGLAQGRTGNALQISYDLAEGGWGSIWKGMDPQLLAGTAGISFWYKGSGASNTIEFKLRLLYPGDTEETYFYTSKHISTNTDGRWKLVEVPYSSFDCKHPGSNCMDARTGKPRALDLMKVVKIDFAIANKSGDKAGVGTVAIDEFFGMKPGVGYTIKRIVTFLSKNRFFVLLGLAFLSFISFIFLIRNSIGRNTGLSNYPIYQTQYVKSDPDAAEAARRKAQVGMAPPGTRQYAKNALHVLSAYQHPNAVTRAKIAYLKEALSKHNDDETQDYD
jgi:hypothetical protein